MPLILPTLSDQNIVDDAIIDLEGNRVSYILTIGNEDFSDKISSEEGEWGTEDSGVNYTDFVLTTPMPRRLEGAPVRFSVVLNDAVIPQLVGIDSLSEMRPGGASTDFQARSAGGLANEITLDEEIECPGWPPEQVVRLATSKLPYTGSKVEPVGEPILHFSKANGGTHFRAEMHPSDMYLAVQSKAPYLFTDTYTGGFSASVSRALGKGGIPARTYDAKDIKGEGWKTPPRIEPRYGKVVVFRRNPDESYAFFAEAAINYRGYSFPPQRSRTYYVELEDPTGQGPQRAQSLANELAGRFLRGVYADELVLPAFDALLMRGDTFQVSEVAKEGSDTYQRSWLAWVKTIKKGTTTLLPTVGYEAMLAFEDKLDVPTLALAGVSGGVLETILDDCDEVGDYLIFSDHTWIAEDGDYLQFAAGAGTVTDNGDYITISCPGTGMKLWGENPPGVLFFNESVSWVSTVGDVLSIDTTASGGVASVSGDVITVNDA